MAPIWHPKNQEVLKSWVEAVLDEASDELNDWESDFIQDMENKLSSGQLLNQNQEEKLEQIYAKYTE